MARKVRAIWIRLHCRCFSFHSFPITLLCCNLAWDLFVHPDRLDLWLAGDGVDQIHQLPILSEDPLLNPRHSARRKSSLGDTSLISSDIMGSAQIDKFKNHLVLGQCVPTERSSCLNFGPISGRLQEGDAKFKINRGRLEGGRGVDAHGVSSQVLVCCRRIERAGNLRKTRLSEVNLTPSLSHHLIVISICFWLCIGQTQQDNQQIMRRQCSLPRS